MNIDWKYKIDVIDLDVFTKIEAERKISFPEDLKKLIIEANAATPSKCKFTVDNVEKVLGAILSFNLNESDTDTVFVAFNAISDTNLMPFGIDPFGNYVCYSLCDKKIIFWDHETDSIAVVNDTLSGFLDSLY